MIFKADDLNSAVIVPAPAAAGRAGLATRPSVLRLLGALGLVAGDRSGRNIVYRLYDNHVAQLLDEAVYHI